MRKNASQARVFLAHFKLLHNCAKYTSKQLDLINIYTDFDILMIFTIVTPPPKKNYLGTIINIVGVGYCLFWVDFIRRAGVCIGVCVCVCELASVVWIKLCIQWNVQDFDRLAQQISVLTKHFGAISFSTTMTKLKTHPLLTNSTSHQ